jgi:rhodanese-related sulfurtransferase
MSESLPPTEASALIDAGAPVIDVREDDEFEAGHIPQAQHVPFERLSEAAQDLPKDARVLFVCRTGDRSGSAADAFSGSGYDAVNIEGGMQAWAEEGLPLEPPGGTVAERIQLPPA